MNEHDRAFYDLARRLGEAYMGQRLRIQVDHAADIFFREGRGAVHVENMDFLYPILRVLLQIVRLYERGQANARAPRVVVNPVPIPSLAPAYHGLRILHLSDLHLDGLPGSGRRWAAAIRPLTFDLCLFSGDLRFQTYGDYAAALAELDDLLPALDCPHGVLGVLGNHDFLECAPPLERRGVRMLLNEAVCIRRAGAPLWIVGVDDAHFYGLDDLSRATRDIPPGEPRILLSHSPELVAEAGRHGINLMLSGHTHGGQIRLPGGFAPMLNISCSRRYGRGAWRYGELQGYTSAGLGCSGLDVRFNCPPEIVIHVLRGSSGP